MKKFKAFCRKALPYVIGLHVVALLTAESVTRILGWVIIVLTAMSFAKSKNDDSKSDLSFLNLEKVFLAFLLAIGVSLSLAEGSFVERFSMFLTGRYVLLFISLRLALAYFDESKLERVFPVWIGLIGLVAIYGIVQTMIGVDLLRPHTPLNLQPYSGGNLFRIQGFFHHPIDFAHTFAIALCFPIAYLLSTSARRNRLWFFSALVSFLGFLAIVWTYTRGAWIALFAAVIVMSLFRLRKALPLIAMLVVGVGLTYLIRPQGFFERASSVTSTTYESNSIRLQIWKANFAMFKDRPVFGIGYMLNESRLQSYFAKLGIVQPFTGHAHNVYLQVLAGTGIVGFLIFLTFIALTFKSSMSAYLKSVRQNDSSPWTSVILLAAIGAQVEIWLGGFTDVTFVDFPINQVYLFVIAFALSWSLRPGRAGVTNA